MTAQPLAEPSQSGSLLTGERHVLELIATGAPLGHTLDALCRVIDEQSWVMSSVFLLDREGRQLTLAAGPHLPDGWRQAIRSFAARITVGSCGSSSAAAERPLSSR